MKILALIARVLLGLMFVVFGSNGFLHFIPMGPMPTGPDGQFLGILMASGYMSVVAGLMLVSGLLLLAGCFVPLALVLLGPILVNIVLFHLTLEPKGFAPGLVATLLWAIVFWNARGAFAGIFRARA